MRYVVLIRHAQSKGNVDRSYFQRVPDHAVELTETGVQQALLLRDVLTKWLTDLEARRSGHTVSLRCSPFERTRDTADILGGGTYVEKTPFGDHAAPIGSPVADYALIEQAAGLFDGLTYEECRERFPYEWSLFDKTQSVKPGRFYARAPNGESPMDVVMRVKDFCKTILTSSPEDHVEIIVSHGVTLRALMMNLCRKDPNWYHDEPNPPNASARVLTSMGAHDFYRDAGWLFKGFTKSGQLIT